MKKTHKEGDNFILTPSTIENVDLAMYEWLKTEMDIYTTTNKGFKKTPVIWVSGERAHQIKNEKELRDKNGVFILPLITIERTSITKDLGKKGKYWGNIPPVNDERGGSITIVEEVQQEKTSNFANAKMKRVYNQPNFKGKNNKVVMRYKTIPMPIYTLMTYTISVKTEYQQQMNDILQPFITFSGGVNYFIIENEGHRYEAFLQSDYSTDNNVSNLQEEERKFETTFTVEVLAHLVGKGLNQDQPKVVERENIVEIKINRERTWTEQDLKNQKVF